MKLPARRFAWLLPLLLTACFHRNHPSQTQPYAPPISATAKPAPAPVQLPPAATTIPSQPLASEAKAEPQQPIKPPPKRKKSASKAAQQAAAAAAPQQAATENAGVSAIGQLSSGGPSDLKQETVDSIAATERELNGISRNLSDQEKKTAGQIREYLKQAKEALASGDADGAHTLAAKAKVLLGEFDQ
jgi:hypothetical protein